MKELQQASGRLDAAARPAWEAWIGPVRDLVTEQPPPGEDDAAFVARLDALAVNEDLSRYVL